MSQTRATAEAELTPLGRWARDTHDIARYAEEHQAREMGVGERATSQLRAISMRPPRGWVVATGACPVASIDRPTDHRGEVALFMGGPWRLVDDHNPEMRRALGCSCSVSLAAPGSRDCPWHADSGGVARIVAEHCAAIIATAQLVDVHQDQGCCRPWGETGWHYVLSAPTLLQPKVACSGRRQGCWLVIDEITAKVRHAQREPALTASEPF